MPLNSGATGEPFIDVEHMYAASILESAVTPRQAIPPSYSIDADDWPMG